jgi:hypothetical protein
VKGGKRKPIMAAGDKLSPTIVALSGLACRCGEKAEYQRGRRMYCKRCYIRRFAA